MVRAGVYNNIGHFVGTAFSGFVISVSYFLMGVSDRSNWGPGSYLFAGGFLGFAVGLLSFQAWWVHPTLNSNHFNQADETIDYTLRLKNFIGIVGVGGTTGVGALLGKIYYDNEEIFDPSGG